MTHDWTDIDDGLRDDIERFGTRVEVETDWRIWTVLCSLAESGIEHRARCSPVDEASVNGNWDDYGQFLYSLLEAAPSGFADHFLDDFRDWDDLPRFVQYGLLEGDLDPTFDTDGRELKERRIP